MRKFTKEELAAKIASAKIYMDAHPHLKDIDFKKIMDEFETREYIGESGAYTTPVKEGDLIPFDENEQLEFHFMKQ
jgi:hypothetical protein